jgi:hypothetical protein
MKLNCIFDKYKNIFGKPGTGIHKYKLLNTAIVDYILSILLAILIAFLTKIPLVLTTISVFILGILAHILFGIDTDVVRFLKLNC